MAVPMRYPLATGWAVVSPSQLMVTLSPPVSPSVVARILMIQKPSVIAGTLVRTCSSPPLVPAYLAGASVVLTRALEFVLDDLPGHRADADLVDPLALPDV